ncbi:MAG: putative nucleic acid-binding Zn-ribbon protein [Cyclobacteriaceae bacterium]|jgi:predicted  nucleic acid-binding Zn-ribbon protein
MAKKATGKIEDMLGELGKKIDILIEEAKVAKDEIRDDVEVKIEDLKQKKEKLEADISQYQQKEKWQEAKGHFVTGIHELKNAMETLISTIRKN